MANSCSYNTVAVKYITIKALSPTIILTRVSLDLALHGHFDNK